MTRAACVVNTSVCFRHFSWGSVTYGEPNQLATANSKPVSDQEISRNTILLKHNLTY